MTSDEELDAVLALLPENATDVVQLGGPGRPWSLRYGGQRAVLRRNDLGRFRAFGQSAQTAFASITWLHEALLGIARIGFVVPEPLPDLDGESVLAAEDAVWELLAHLPGTQMGWSDAAGRARSGDRPGAGSTWYQMIDDVPSAACRFAFATRRNP